MFCKRNFISILFYLSFTFIIHNYSFGQQLIYLNSEIPVEKRVEDLLERMTLEEKIGQMNMPCVYLHQFGKDKKSKLEACIKFAAGTLEPGIGPGGGFFTLPNSAQLDGPEEQARILNELQRVAVEETRMKIPLLMTEEGTHGLMCSGGTGFPEGLAIGSAWDMQLVEDIYSVVAR